MSNVPKHPLPLRFAIAVARGLPADQQHTLIIASIDSELARLEYEHEPSLAGAGAIANADVVLTQTIASLKGTTQ